MTLKMKVIALMGAITVLTAIQGSSWAFCLSDRECPAGMKCIAKKCTPAPIDPDDPIGEHNENPCQSDRDCPDFKQCNARSCVLRPGRCAISSDCSQCGYACGASHFCEKGKMYCAGNIDCKAGQSCYHCACSATQCTGNNQCPENFLCSMNQCDPNSASCQLRPDCAADCRISDAPGNVLACDDKYYSSVECAQCKGVSVRHKFSGTQWQAVSSPYRNYAYLYKGNTHIHTNASDGKLPLADVAKLYSDKGFDFIAITDHNKVSTKGDTGIAKPLIITGCESGDYGENHIIAVGIDTCPEECASNQIIRWKTGIKPFCNNSEAQKRINQALKQNGLVILAHPSSINNPLGVQDGWSTDRLEAVKGYHAVEINNSVDQWQFILKLPYHDVAWGVAGDDFHEGNAGSSAIVVNSNKASVQKDDILSNIKSGNFFSIVQSACCTSPTLQRIDASIDGITVFGKNAKFVRFVLGGNVVRTVNVSEGKPFVASVYPSEVDPRASQGAIRVEAVDAKNNVAYSQAIHFTAQIKEKPIHGTKCQPPSRCCGAMDSKGYCDSECVKPPQQCE